MSYTNEDLAVVGPQSRTWNTWNYAALWISMSLCIPTYMLASSFIEGGMNWQQAILTIFIGNVIVLIPMVLNGYAGAKYGIPFPVMARASFGLRGANFAAILRAIVACGWFGIQTWIGGSALYQIIHQYFPGIDQLPALFPEGFGLSTGHAITFLLFWSLNMYVIHKGIDSIRRLLLFKAFILPIIAIALVIWAIDAAHGLGPILERPSKFQSTDEFLSYFFPALTGVVGFWATISLNIPDFTRYAKTQRAQIVGQTLGLPLSMAAFSFVGVVTTSATIILFGEAMWDPVALAGKFSSPVVVTVAMTAVIVSTLATNIAANIVGPANDFANLAPRHIDFRRGGFITGFLGLFIMPWKLMADPSGYIFTWLIAYSALLGPLGGIMIADYFFIRKTELVVSELYLSNGRYWFNNGFNPVAFIAFVLGTAPNIPGFLITIGLLPADSVPAWVAHLYHYAWFIGFGISMAVYYILSSKNDSRR